MSEPDVLVYSVTGGEGDLGTARARNGITRS